MNKYFLEWFNEMQLDHGCTLTIERAIYKFRFPDGDTWTFDGDAGGCLRDEVVVQIIRGYDKYRAYRTIKKNL
jgi:hypothetical protein